MGIGMISSKLVDRESSKPNSVTKIDTTKFKGDSYILKQKNVKC